MKYSNYIGVVAALALIACCFVPWVYIAPIKTTITGVSAENTNFGRPGILHIFFAAISIALFLLPRVWAKRANLFVATFNLAWSVRNFLIITHCELGECPEKKMGIYALLILSFLLEIMALLPKIELKEDISVD
ncbi:MAG TPA: hypothetical protein VF610_02655 [Segetibacter sp.]|jgi:hypothetical protein